MNGKASKRIWLAAALTGRTVKEMKREYKRLPYHRRKIAGIEVKPHKEAIRRLRWIMTSNVDV